MKKTNTESIVRAALRQHSDGLTLTEIAGHTGLLYRAVHRAVAKMPDVYIDRWQASEVRKRHQAIWCVVVPPENCPHPIRGTPAAR